MDLVFFIFPANLFDIYVSCDVDLGLIVMYLYSRVLILYSLMLNNKLAELSKKLDELEKYWSCFENIHEILSF